MKISKILPLVGLTLFVYIVNRAGPDVIVGTLTSMNLTLFAASLTFNIPVVSAKVFRWMKIIESTGETYDFRRAMKAWFVGFSTGLITPGRVGDFFRSSFLKKDRKMSFGSAISTVIVDRIFDIGSLLFLAGFGALTLFGIADANVIGGLALTLLAFIASSAAFFKKKFTKRLFRPVFEKFVPEKYKKAIRGGFSDFYKSTNEFFKNPKQVFVTTSLTFIAWLLTIAQFTILARALGIDLGYMFMLSAIPIVIIAEVLPISFAGLGTRDAVLIVFFALKNLSAAAAVSFSMAILISNYILGIPGYILWLKSTKNVDEKTVLKKD